MRHLSKYYYQVVFLYTAWIEHNGKHHRSTVVFTEPAEFYIESSYFFVRTVKFLLQLRESGLELLRAQLIHMGTYNFQTMLYSNLLRILPAALLAALLISSGCDTIIGIADNGDQEPERTIFETIDQSEGFEEVAERVSEAGMQELLDESEDITFFPPENEAFDRLDPEVMELLDEEENAWLEVMRYHLVGDDFELSELINMIRVETLHGGQIFVTTFQEGQFTEEVLINNNAQVFQFDVRATNGVMHAVDEVLLPDRFETLPSLISKRNALTMISERIEDTGFFDELSQSEAETHTMFIPNNEAFEAFGQDTWQAMEEEERMELLRNHTLEGEWLTDELAGQSSVENLQGNELQMGDDALELVVNEEAEVIERDIEGRTGVIHIIDTVIEP